MKFKNLNEREVDVIKKIYSEDRTQLEKQTLLSDFFGVTKRCIRNWANKLELNETSIISANKIMVYDIETSRAKGKFWWTGKQYIGHHQLTDEPKIISIAWKWLNNDKVYFLSWDKNHCDKKMLVEFLKEYNDADMVIGQNNDKFDNRWINARAMKHELDVDVNIKSFDIMKQTKRLFRLPSYSMAYITKYLGVTLKQSHEGIRMWDMIEDGTLAEQKEYLQKMKDYNIGDIVSTEEIYLKLRKYMGHKVHFGALNGKSKYSCPNCGGDNIELIKTTTTAAGTIQRMMQCKKDQVQFKVSNTEYLKNNL